VARQQEMTALRCLRTLFNVGAAAGLTDGQLLEQFVARRGESAELAFAALVERHGPMVLRVCRSVLRDEHESQDAFQATFLVLAGLAGSLWVRDSLGPWLYRVARRAAVRAKRASDRRQAAEQRAAELAVRSAVDPGPDDLGVLYEEIDRLPGRYRVPIVLCDVEDHSHEEAARHLGWPVGTVKSRIARGRLRLKMRLTRRGLGVPAGLLTAGVFAKESRATPPVPLVDATVQAATRFAAGSATAAGSVTVAVAALTEGVLMTMFLTKARMIALAAVTLGLVTLATGVVAQQLGPRGVPAESDRLRQVEAKLDRLLEALDRNPERVAKPPVPTPDNAKAPREGVTQTKGLNIRKEPIARLVFVVNKNQDKRIVILEEWMTDLRDPPARPNRFMEYLHFSLKGGRAYRADGRPIPEGSLWDQLPNDPALRQAVLLAADDRVLRSPYLNALREDTIILIGETEYQAMGTLPGE
jgi:RNA polymerase sigma factor (sigma-70 family)